MAKSNNNVARWLAPLVIVLIATAAGLGTYFANKSDNTKTESQIQAPVSDITESSQSEKLNNCIDDVNTRFKDALKGQRVTSQDAKTILDYKKQAVEECQIKYPTN